MKKIIYLLAVVLSTSVFVGCSNSDEIDGVCMDEFRVRETIGENEFYFSCYDEYEFEFQHAEPFGWDGIGVDPKVWIRASAQDAGNGIYTYKIKDQSVFTITQTSPKSCTVKFSENAIKLQPSYPKYWLQFRNTKLDAHFMAVQILYKDGKWQIWEGPINTINGLY